MRVVVTGATGTIGTSLVAALDRDPAVEEVVALARRPPANGFGGRKVRWSSEDVAEDDLAPVVDGADAVVHLAWALNPSHGRAVMRRVNLEGSRRVFEAAAAAGVGTLVHTSSLAAYSPGPKDRLVDESWPTGGVRGSGYSQDKVAVERRLDAFEREHPELRVVRMRPVLVLKRTIGGHLAAEFVGGWLPRGLVRPEKLPLLLSHPRLRSQLVHGEDVAEAFRLALHADVSGAFNLAAEPVVDVHSVAGRTGARTLPLPFLPPLGPWHAVAHRLGILRGEPGWTALTLQSPLLDAGRARRELGWKPAHDALDTMFEALDGLRAGDSEPTPAVEAQAS